MIYDYPYEATPADTEIFITEEPVDLVKEHIKDQFDFPMENRVDYVGSYIDSYNYSVAKLIETEEDEQDIDSINDDFIKFMIDIFKYKLNIGLPGFEDMSAENQLDMIQMIYRYFIINMKHNFSCFCLNYIEKHKHEIAESQPKKKDVTSIDIKKDIDDPDDLVIIPNLYSIIRQIIYDNDHDIDLFVEFSDRNDPHLETDMMKEYVRDFKVTGNFYPFYRNLLDEEFLKEIESKIRNKLLKKYRK